MKDMHIGSVCCEEPQDEIGYEDFVDEVFEDSKGQRLKPELVKEARMAEI